MDFEEMKKVEKCLLYNRTFTGSEKFDNSLLSEIYIYFLNFDTR